ncbi:hypothetical protein ACFXAW_28310 [Streptomyces sp. NPDC059445]|uniref:hypothetical protein n=1 Tax=Streptomyces sp. NPDC059445 TaxID=3346832 RepID=UPI00369C779C
MLFGLLAASAPAVAATAAQPCGGTFEQRLGCWARATDEGTVRVTVDRSLPFDGRAANRKGFEQTLVDRSARLLVEVPSGVHTGEGGTALVVLADHDHRFLADDAVIDALKPGTVKELADRRACDPRKAGDLCARLAKGRLTGADLVRLGLATDLSRTDTVGGSAAGTSANPGGDETATGQQGQGQGQGQSPAQGQGQGETGKAGDTGRDPGTSTDPGDGGGWDTATAVLTVLCAVLVLLLGVLLFLIRRSARSVAVGTLSRRSLAAPGVGAVPAASTPRPRGRPRTHASDQATTRTRVSDEAAAPPRTRMPDEATTRLRATPAPRSHGRRVGNVPGPARPAVVRTELHPQGYVEVDHVLYRAVWAEPGRPPPAPGGLVDVTEAGERDSDVLYAFPPTPGRHAKAARP